MTNINLGTAHEELGWIDVQEHSVKILNQQGKYLFVTSFEAMEHPDIIDQARKSGHKVITIPENLKYKIQGSTDLSGNPIVDISQFVSSYNDSFNFTFIEIDKLNDKEKAIYNLTPKIIELFGGQPEKIKSIKISSTMRKDFFADAETLGCWDENSNSIVISRKALETIDDYSGTLIHELIHAKTEHNDVTRAFESSLTETIGHLCGHILEELCTRHKSSFPKAGQTWLNKLFGNY